MPRRGRAPGLKRGRHNLPYWIAKQIVRDPLGYPDICVPLPPDATEEELIELCQSHTVKLRAWIAERDPSYKPREPNDRMTVTRYDGTLRSACRIYQEHPLSAFHKVKHNTRRGYLADLKVIEQSVGSRLVRNVTILDVRHWYDQWKKPAVTIEADGSRRVGSERIDRAHNAVAMVRTVVYFLAALRHPDCKELAAELKHVKFERGGSREQELTYRHVRDFIRAAFDLANRGVISRDRALYMSIGTASQFELMLRQKDIIGDWSPRIASAQFPTGITVLHQDDETWTGFYTWESVPGWRWRTRTSKSKYRAAAEFDLTLYDLLFPLLEAVPPEQRHGAIVKGEHGLPVRYRSYAKWWRQIAKVAGIPDEVQSMDARAGGATEAEEAGADIDAIQDALTHTKKTTTLRYVRRRSRKIAVVAEARKQSRVASGEGNAED